MTSKFKILSIDGGGIRGIIPGIILAEIEKRTQQPVSSLFDLIAGTSTGGIIAIGLALPGVEGFPKFSSEDLVGLYEKNGKTIFPGNKLMKLVRKFKSIFSKSYSKDGIEKVLQEYFGEGQLKELIVDVLITSYEIEKRKPFYFLSRLAKDPEYEAVENFKVKDIARSTSAAPTFFEPSWVKWMNGDHLTLVDGGVFANNPGMLAYTEAQELVKLTEPKAFDPILTPNKEDQEFFMLSLGTGNTIKSYKYAEAKSWGLAGWARPLLDILMQGVSESVHYQMQYVLPSDKDGKLNYFRLNTIIQPQHSQMDDASEENIEVLKKYGQEMIKTYDKELDIICNNISH